MGMHCREKNTSLSRKTTALTRTRLSTEHPAVSETGTLQLRPQEFETVCRQTYVRQTCHTPGSGGR